MEHGSQIRRLGTPELDVEASHRFRPSMGISQEVNQPQTEGGLTSDVLGSSVSKSCSKMATGRPAQRDQPDTRARRGGTRRETGHTDVRRNELVHHDAAIPNPTPLLELVICEENLAYVRPLVRVLVKPQILGHTYGHTDVQPGLRHGTNTHFTVSKQQQCLTGTGPTLRVCAVQNDLGVVHVAVASRPHLATRWRRAIGARIPGRHGEHGQK